MPTYDDLYNALQLVGGLLILVGVAVALMPVAECSECQHCRRLRTKDGFCKLHARPESECRGMHDE